jgi:hypothetical protein
MTVAMLEAAGATRPEDVDIFISMIGGLINQQQTNEPGGDRWIRHLDTVLDMFFRDIDDHAAAHSDAKQPGRPKGRIGTTAPLRATLAPPRRTDEPLKRGRCPRDSPTQA